jgi:hypothetical protein
MPLKRAAMIVGGSAALAAWLAAATTSGRRSNVELLPVKSLPVDRRGAELANEIERLHERLRPTTTPRQPARNLFSYAAPKGRPVAPAASVPRPALSEAAPVRPVPPPLKLSGIAEDTADGAVVRTAIISSRGQVVLVKEGENVDRYRVVKIGSEAVELNDLTDGSTLRLALK